jgi:hypothetical protein
MPQAHFNGVNMAMSRRRDGRTPQKTEAALSKFFCANFFSHCLPNGFLAWFAKPQHTYDDAA